MLAAGYARFFTAADSCGAMHQEAPFRPPNLLEADAVMWRTAVRWALRHHSALRRAAICDIAVIVAFISPATSSFGGRSRNQATKPASINLRASENSTESHPLPADARMPGGRTYVYRVILPSVSVCGLHWRCRPFATFKGSLLALSPADNSALPRRYLSDFGRVVGFRCAPTGQTCTTFGPGQSVAPAIQRNATE